jgi:hypothetical protein
VNEGKFDEERLSDEQKALRDWYRKLLHVMHDKAFTDGDFFGLNHANKDNPQFGRIGDESVSGHWLYAFLRSDRESGRAFLVVANFHGDQTICGASVRIPRDAHEFIGRADRARWRFSDRLETSWCASIISGALESMGLMLPDLPPCTSLLLEIGDG